MNNLFRNRVNQPRLSREEQDRQSKVTKGAINAFAKPADAILFLNSHHDDLKARPLALAIESETGLSLVEAVLNKLNTKPA